MFAPSMNDAYAGSTFPGLVDLLYEIERSENPDERWEQVRHHLAAIIFAIQSAEKILRDTKAYT